MSCLRSEIRRDIQTLIDAPRALMLLLLSFSPSYPRAASSSPSICQENTVASQVATEASEVACMRGSGVSIREGASGDGRGAL